MWIKQGIQQYLRNANDAIDKVKELQEGMRNFNEVSPLNWGMNEDHWNLSGRAKNASD